MSSDNFDSTVCTPEQVKDSGSSGFYCYTRRQNIGLVVVSLVGFLSLAAVITIFCLILRNIIRNRRLSISPRPRLISTPMDLLMLSLFVADFFQSLGVVLDVKWVNDGIVGVGGLCTAQGVLQNIGQAGVAMTTFIITLHTFDILWRGESISLGRAYILIGNVWAFLILTITISASVHQNPSFYAPTPYWCWINSSYPEYRIALENFWLWIGFAVSVLYIPLLFWDAGLVKPRNPQWWTFELNPSDAQPSRRRFKLIICALAYCLPVIPTALARWFLVVHGDVKPFATAEAQFIVKGIFSLSGVCDVVAFKFARSGLLLFPSHDSPEETAPKADDGSDDISLADMNSGGNAQNASVTPKPWWRHQRRILFLCFWIVVNVLDIVWITYYIRAATDPNPRTPVNRSHAGWQAYYLIMYVFGFFWGCVNIVVWMAYFQPSQSSSAITRSKGALHHFWRCVRLPILFPIAILMGLGPFFAPFVGVNRAQQHAWKHRCDAFAVEVILSGLSYNAPDDQAPIATFHFRQPNGTLIEGYTYNLTNDGATSIWQFAPSAAQSLVEVTYDISNFTLQATCPGNTSQCTQGSFQESGFLSFSLTDSFNYAVTNLRAVDKDWVYGHSDDAPSFLLKEVLPDGSLGNVVVRTAVTQPGHCANLKLCASDARGETLVPIGLTLMKQNEYSRVCTTPNSN